MGRVGKHILIWLAIVVLVLFSWSAVPSYSVDRGVPPAERQYNINVFGHAQHQVLEHRAEKLFTGIFREGEFGDLVLWSTTLYREPLQGIESEQAADRFVRNYVANVWFGLLRVCYRIATFGTWFFALLALMFAAGLDGWCAKRLARQGFQVKSGASVFNASHSLIFLLGASVLLFLIPVALTAVAWTVLLFAMPLLVRVIAKSV